MATLAQKHALIQLARIPAGCHSEGQQLPRACLVTVMLPPPPQALHSRNLKACKNHLDNLHHCLSHRTSPAVRSYTWTNTPSSAPHHRSTGTTALSGTARHKRRACRHGHATGAPGSKTRPSSPAPNSSAASGSHTRLPNRHPQLATRAQVPQQARTISFTTWMQPRHAAMHTWQQLARRAPKNQSCDRLRPASAATVLAGAMAASAPAGGACQRSPRAGCHVRVRV